MPSRHRLIYLLLPSLLMSQSLPVAAITGTPSWKPRELVADQLVNANFVSESQLAFDHHGNPGIAFFDAVDGDLRYARRVPGAGWVHGVVDSAGTTGRRPSLKFDRYERPAIAYYTTSVNDVFFSHYDGTAWQTHLAYDGTSIIGQSLAFDILGRPAITAYGSNGLHFIQDTDGDFRFDDETPVTITGGFSAQAELVFDSLNRPMVAYVDATTFDISFAVEEPGVGWVTSTIDGNTGVDYPSIAIDPKTGLPVVAYERSADVMYAEWDGTAWNSTLVDSPAASTITGVSLAFDQADENPAIAYRINAGTNDLLFAWNNGVSWNTQAVDLSNIGPLPSLAFNTFGNGFPSIAYVEEAGTFDNLYFIEDPPLIVPEPRSVCLMCVGATVGLARRRKSADV